MHEHYSCKYDEKSWREDASLLKTIDVWDLTGELVVYQHSHCHVSVQALQHSANLGGHIIVCMMTHRALRFTESNALVKSTKAMHRLRCCSLPFSISCLIAKLISVVPRFRRKLFSLAAFHFVPWAGLMSTFLHDIHHFFVSPGQVPVFKVAICIPSLIIHTAFFSLTFLLSRTRSWYGSRRLFLARVRQCDRTLFGGHHSHVLIRV